MQVSSINNNVNFKGITPIRVYENGVEILDERVVKNACAKVIKAFCGPLESKYKPAAAQLEISDRDYSYFRAMRGYVDKFERSDDVPSNYIKVIYDRSNRGYLVTGRFSDDLSVLGRRMGLAQKEAKSLGLKTTQAFEEARDAYWEYVRKIGNDLSNRTTEAYNRATGAKIGGPAQIIANISTKPVRSHGKQTSTVKLDNMYMVSSK